MLKLFVVILSSALAFPQEGVPEAPMGNIATELDTADRYRQAGRYQDADVLYEAVLATVRRKMDR